MSVLTGATGSSGLYVDSTPVTDAPLTIAMWFYPTTSSTHTLGGLVDASTDVENWVLECLNSGADPQLYVRDASANEDSAICANEYNTSAWNSFLGIEGAGGSDHVAVLNADWANRGTSTGLNTPDNIDRICIGGRLDASPNIVGDHLIAEFCLWDVALTQYEILAFGAGVRGWRIRPESLVAYYPLIDSYMDLSGGGRHLSTTGSPSLSLLNPPLEPFWPSAPALPYAVAAAQNITPSGLSVAPAFGTPNLLDVQELLPDATIASGAWTAEPSGTLDGVTSDKSDTTYAQLLLANEPSVFEVELDSAQEPGTTEPGGHLRLRIEKN